MFRPHALDLHIALEGLEGSSERQQLRVSVVLARNVSAALDIQVEVLGQQALQKARFSWSQHFQFGLLGNVQCSGLEFFKICRVRKQDIFTKILLATNVLICVPIVGEVVPESSVLEC